MIEGLTPINVLLGLSINGVFTGIGVAVGTFVANKHIIERIEKVEKKVKKIVKNENRKV